ncbi:hypothetical protein BCR33DRAFT_712678 [Rhizoclosmatium globosum]|uniref:Uncharacterized protein n=1 Tax=Rhizoclosmatium globosum TaxID=329046 RepID=A0A1Y2CXV1_9FUNG|nr:hypothetical protein BCR33DRAFT_712678 [Rhizoclosmatium globosum]|eukprot:ORY51664.1 hypothetical protein BCR33DRAFT_712678 [Rhizoclosmatium globosum]
MKEGVRILFSLAKLLEDSKAVILCFLVRSTASKIGKGPDRVSTLQHTSQQDVKPV